MYNSVNKSSGVRLLLSSRMVPIISTISCSVINSLISSVIDVVLT